MNRIESLLIGWTWPVLAALGSLLMLAAAHGFERWAMLAPCPLCLRQREVYWAVISMCLTALVLKHFRPNPRFLMAFNVLLGMVFLTGMVVAAFHAGVEWGFWPAPSGCAAGAIDVSNLDLNDLNQRQATASCNDIPWSLLGLSMAGWNTLISLGLATISFRSAWLLRPSSIRSVSA